MSAPFALAFTAGLVATVNPCGIAMLPVYLSYFLGTDAEEPRSGAGTVGRALTIGAVVSLGFLLVFGAAGALLTVGVREVVGVMPWAALVVGAAIALLGVAMLFGFELAVDLPKLGRGGGGRGYGAAFTFGISYAVASLSCTLPIFLAVVAGTIPTLSLAAGIATFVVYGLGMSLVLLVLTLGIALGQRSIVRRVRASAQYVNRVAGGILVVAGGYIVYFWSSNLAGGGLTQSDPVVFVERLSSRLTNAIGGAPVLLGVGLASVVVAALVYAWWASQQAPAAAADATADVDDEPAGLRTGR